MRKEKYLQKLNMSVVNQSTGAATPVYHLDQKGREQLAAHFDDEQFLLCPMRPRQPQHLLHAIAVTDTHMLLRKAIEQQNKIQLTRFINEDEIVNVDEPAKSKHFRLYTEISKSPKLVFTPDAAFELLFNGDRASFYLEQDRDSYFHKRVAALKSPGYEAFLNRKLHKKHFPDTSLAYFFVLVVCPTAKRRDQLCNAFAARNIGKTVERVYRFLSLEDATTKSLLTNPILKCCHREDMVALVRNQLDSPSATLPPSSRASMQSGLQS